MTQEILHRPSFPWRVLESPALSYSLQVASDPDRLRQKSDGNSNYQFLPSFCASYYWICEPFMRGSIGGLACITRVTQKYRPLYPFESVKQGPACHYRITLLYNEFSRLQGVLD
jgi:hypothetical protein